MDEHVPLPPHLVRRRVLFVGVFGLIMVVAAGLYLLTFDFGTESGIVFGIVLTIGALLVAIAIRHWRRAAP